MTLPAAPSKRPTRLAVIGASAGGVESLCRMLDAVPPDLGGAIVIAMHIPADVPSSLPRILSTASRRVVRFAWDGQPIEQGAIYVAPPGHDLLVSGREIRLPACDPGQRFRPSVDMLFQSAAYTFGSNTVGVVLSGMLDDGALGIRAIHRAGGMTVVQEPAEAQFDGMPSSAMKASQVDRVLPAQDIGKLLGRLMPAEAPSAGAGAEPQVLQQRSSDGEQCLAAVLRNPALLTHTCADCRKVLEKLQACRPSTGNSPADGACATLELLESGVMLLQHLSRHLHAGGLAALAQEMSAGASELERRSEPLRQQQALLRRRT